MTLVASPSKDSINLFGFVGPKKNSNPGGSLPASKVWIRRPDVQMRQFEFARWSQRRENQKKRVEDETAEISVT